MESYRTLDAAQLQQALLRERERHDSFCAQGLALNMAGASRATSSSTCPPPC